MKRLAFLATVVAALAVFGALDFSAARAIPVITSAATVNSGATNVAAVTLGSLRGSSEIIVTANGNASRTALDVSLWNTNAVEGGWIRLTGETFTATNAGVYRVVFPGQFATADAQVRISSAGAGTSVTAFILSY